MSRLALRCFAASAACVALDQVLHTWAALAVAKRTGVVEWRSSYFDEPMALQRLATVFLACGLIALVHQIWTVDERSVRWRIAMSLAAAAASLSAFAAVAVR